MRKKKTWVYTLIIGLVVIAATLLLFWIDNTTAWSRWTGLAFLILSEIFLFGGMIFLQKSYQNGDKALYWQIGVGSILVLYFVCTLILYFVLRSKGDAFLSMYLTIQIILSVFFLTFALSFLATGRRSLQRKSNPARSALQDLQLLALNDKNDEQFSSCKAVLQTLADTAQYSQTKDANAVIDLAEQLSLLTGSSMDSQELLAELQRIQNELDSLNREAAIVSKPGQSL